jgi:hypothetical protein
MIREKNKTFAFLIGFLEKYWKTHASEIILIQLGYENKNELILQWAK